MPSSTEATQRRNLPCSPIPITLLSGFLGSGKTTLLERILTTEHGLKIAVVINDVSLLNIDAALIQNHKVTKKEEKLIQLQNGCICCTLRGDLLEELVSLATAGEFQYIIIESTGISEPMQVAETFTTEFSEQMLQSDLPEEEVKVLQEILALGGLNKLTKLDTCVTMIDAVNFMSNFETTEFLADRYGDNGQGETERTITDLMVDQIEFADVVIINKFSSLQATKAGRKQAKRVEGVIQALNPVAKIIKCDYAKVNVKDVINTKLFDFEKASTSAGWLQSINEMTVREGFGDKSKATLTPKPETEEYGINHFIYQSRRPFHPERLYRTLREKFLIIEQSGVDEHDGEGETDEENEGVDEDDNENEKGTENNEGNEAGGRDSDMSESESEDDQEDEEDEDLSEQQLIENKKASVFGPMLRSKGFFWLASRHIIRGEWLSAGSMLTMKGGVPWFCVTGPEFIPPEAAELIQKDMKGKYGDRRNEIVFIGLNIDKKGLQKAMDECLLNDEEFAEYENVIKLQKNLISLEKKLQTVFEDGFESWIQFDEE
ncbi:cobW-domain-containing protein [Metschnikowia bicuspidata var. bicuspidata NRRL YB-4993]|uniref:CobW-domain-containing protein n=1 Tax=Metschnikowia bicuspidata var. bicuspidata NRRL YB-4993 TaxID=869754 RepID=A0A1A0HFK2_9ASCO|nr:cobW-domain-containing protein [Metschnikowia bicuspidata var. bicuspidata NRRL YB-4993]OBA22765.1 cobW-domain-containing protein [Metschnikowia bicuspidata var. bicuspidata NRRL YB-4993]